MLKLSNDWDEVLAPLIETDNYRSLARFLLEEYNSQTVYPRQEELFAALRATPYQSVRVVILGQDPYHKQGQAHGMCFSVPYGIPTPPSLRNIFKELSADLGCYIPNHGNLTAWANQGVLLLNSVLSVRASQPLSHAKAGWQQLTDGIIASLSSAPQPVVFMLWGAYARSKKPLISGDNLILESAHPSPLSARHFLGCGHFSKANQFLAANNLPIIDWQIKNV